MVPSLVMFNDSDGEATTRQPGSQLQEAPSGQRRRRLAVVVNESRHLFSSLHSLPREPAGCHAAKVRVGSVDRNHRIAASVLLYFEPAGVRMGGRVAVLKMQSNLPPPSSPSRVAPAGKSCHLADSGQWAMEEARAPQINAAGYLLPTQPHSGKPRRRVEAGTRISAMQRSLGIC